MLKNYLQDIKVVLGSQSPRRKELLASLGIDFDVIIKSVDESIPSHVNSSEAAEYVALKKLEAFDAAEFQDVLIITSDTVVVDNANNVLGKPSSAEEAKQVISSLSGRSHIVYTGVGLAYKGKKSHFTDKTTVHFEDLTPEEIQYYVDRYKPFDKAGAYGIQEWIGRIAVSKIEGSYENVMGLPTVRVYQAIKEIIK
ncbi:MULTISPECIES: Maf family protein [Sphingobacterium]|uniref:dTTP/UTP pyrophosphatase n=1 Tax=Sphingobacterium litopenaei TaxID=2763500 RepID=A0ABR7YHS8_9SPHI|nr:MULTISPECIES: Maf family protein [Sphingobacterium]MBD1430862.1 septum formation protein Maf [Sphingobacterium litopenaei]NGM74591.1 septum formation protein Maf [Sphingobacterium sp. SGL-16]